MNSGEVCFTIQIQETEAAVDCYICRLQYLQA